jgi:hypothetical protein
LWIDSDSAPFAHTLCEAGSNHQSFSTITTLIIMYKPNLLSSFIIKERRRAKQVGRFLLFSTKKDAFLFTPGPLTTSATVKAAMLCDAGSRDPNFLECNSPSSKRDYYRLEV